MKQISKGYKKYVNGEIWKKRRALYFQKFGKVCAKCKGFTSIQLHHKTYKNIMREKDEDLIPLCTPCHKLFHKVFNKTSEDNTDIFIGMDVSKYKAYQLELKKEREKRKKQKKKKEKKEPKYQGRGKYKLLTPKSIRRIHNEVAEEPMFDFMKSLLTKNLNKIKKQNGNTI